jgi:type IV secretion system protein VirB3
MFLGVTLDYMSIIVLICLCAFILMGSASYLLLYIPLHLCGWAACRADHHIFNLISKKLSCGKVRNYKIWGCQSYEPF